MVSGVGVASGLDGWHPGKGRIYGELGKDGSFVTSETMAILATPHPTYDSPEVINDAKVIGLVQDWNMSQTRQAPQLFEVGSKGKYTLSTGKVAGSMSISRIMYNGANLLATLYAIDHPTAPPDLTGFSDSEWDVAGYGNFLISLASTLFTNPLGIICVFRSTKAMDSKTTKNIGAFFLEGTYIVTHGIGASAGAPYIGEQVQLSFETIKPIQVNSDAIAPRVPKVP